MKRGTFVIVSHVLLALTIFGTQQFPVFAAKDTTASATSAKDKQIEDLKERLATKVAELSESKKAAIYGTVTAVTLTTVSVDTSTKEVKIELPDGIRVIQSINGKRTVLSTDDIEKGDTISVFGDYDTALDLLKAKVIIIENDKPLRIFGNVSETNGTTYTITVESVSGQTYIADYERSTKAFGWIGSGEPQKSGFSKLKKGMFVTILGLSVPKEQNRLSAMRILTVEKSVAATPTPTVSEETPESTKSPTPKSK